MVHQPIAPLAVDQRIDLVDVIRGIAVCGILAVNIFVMGTVGSTQGRSFPAEWNADWIAWVSQRLLLERPMRGLFMILFGAGMLMISARPRAIARRSRPSTSGRTARSLCWGSGSSTSWS